MLTALADQNRDVRNSAARALGQLGSEAAVAPLLEQLKDRNVAVRVVALLALAKIGDSNALQAVTDLFRSKEEKHRVKIAAAVALLALNSREGLPFLTTLIESQQAADKTQIAEALGTFSIEPGVQLLLSLLKDDNNKVRLQAIKSLGQTKAKTALPPLRSILENSDLPIPAQLAAMTALRNIETAEAVQVILEAVEQRERILGLHAYQLLGDLRTELALPLLQKRLTQLEDQYRQWRKIRDAEREDFTQDEAQAWREALEAARPESYWAFDLAYAIARIDPKESGIELLSHDLADVRYGAWKGLGKVGTVQLVQRLDQMRAESEDPLFRYAAYRAIDHTLTRIGVTGGEQDLVDLRKLLAQVAAREEVHTRVEWTILQLEGLS